MRRAAAGAQPGMLKGKSQCPGTRMSLRSLSQPPAPSPRWGPSTISCLSFPPARGGGCSGSSPPSSPLRPCAGGAAHRPCPTAGLHAQQDTSGSCLFLGVRTSSSQPSIRPQAHSVTAQTHKPVGAAAGSAWRRDGAAWRGMGADPKTHPTLCSTAETPFTWQPLVPTLPTSCCLCCLRCLCCLQCWPGSASQGCRGQRWRRGVPVPLLPQW